MSNDFKIGDKEYLVKRPLADEHKKAQLAYNEAFGNAIKSGAVLRAKLNQYMEEQKLWSEEKSQRFLDLVKFVNESDKKLEKGGFKFKEAVELSKDNIKKRKELNDMLLERGNADSSTAEGQAENIKFQKLLTLCLVYKDDGKPVFNSVDDLLNETDKTKLMVAERGFDILGDILFKLDSKAEHKLAAYKFLLEFKLVDDKLRFINSQGQLVDDSGRRINDKGQLINDKDEPIDFEGNRIDEDGNLLVERAPFLDDDGNPIVV